MDGINLFKFALIALSLPAQYFLSQYWSNDVMQQNEAFTNLMSTMVDFKSSYLEMESWKNWYKSFVIDIPKQSTRNGANLKKTNLFKKNSIEASDNDVLAVEVFAYRQNLVHFAESSIIRSPRSAKVKYKVGQVVWDKKYDLYGVIIGWDEMASAPDTWINRNYNNEQLKEKYLTKPHYLVLVDEKYQKKFRSKAYIVQDEIEIVHDVQIKHRSLSAYFYGYDGSKYVSKKYLKTVYPHDD